MGQDVHEFGCLNGRLWIIAKPSVKNVSSVTGSIRCTMYMARDMGLKPASFTRDDSSEVVRERIRILIYQSKARGALSTNFGK